MIAAVFGILALWHSRHRHSWKSVAVQAGYCVGYICGGLCHHYFPNRASDDDCASHAFYVFWTISYSGMGFAALCHVSFCFQQELSRLAVFAGSSLCFVCLVMGVSATWCIATVENTGGEDSCATSPGALCDHTFLYAELAFVQFTLACWFACTWRMQDELKVHGWGVRAANRLAPLCLLSAGWLVAVMGLVIADPVLYEAIHTQIIYHFLIFCGLSCTCVVHAVSQKGRSLENNKQH